jgi:hypothetical protein
VFFLTKTGRIVPSRKKKCILRRKFLPQTFVAGKGLWLMQYAFAAIKCDCCRKMSVVF